MERKRVNHFYRYFVLLLKADPQLKEMIEKAENYLQANVILTFLPEIERNSLKYDRLLLSIQGQLPADSVETRRTACVLFPGAIKKARMLTT